MSVLSKIGTGVAYGAGYSIFGAPAVLGYLAYAKYNNFKAKKDMKTEIETGGLISKQWESLNTKRDTHFWQLPGTKKNIAGKEDLRKLLLANINMQVETNLFGNNNPFEIYKQSLEKTSPLNTMPDDNEHVQTARKIIKDRYNNVNEKESTTPNENLKLCIEAFEKDITSINKSMVDGKISDPRTIAKQLHTLRFNTYKLVINTNKSLVNAQIEDSNALFDAAILLHKDENATLPTEITDDANNFLQALKNSGQLDINADETAAKLSSNGEESTVIDGNIEPLAEVSGNLPTKDLTQEEIKANQITKLEALKGKAEQRIISEADKRNLNLNNKLASLAQEHMLHMNREINAGYLLNRLSNKEEAKYAQENIFEESDATGKLAKVGDIKQKSNKALILETRDQFNGITTDGGKMSYKDGTYNIKTSKLSRGVLRSSLKDQACMVATEYSSIKWKAKATKSDKNGRKVVDHQAVAKLAGEQVIATILQSGLDPKKSKVSPQTGVDNNGQPTYDNEPIKILEFKDSNTYKNMTTTDKTKFDKDYDKAIKARDNDVTIDLFTEQKNENKDNVHAITKLEDKPEPEHAAQLS